MYQGRKRLLGWDAYREHVQAGETGRGSWGVFAAFFIYGSQLLPLLRYRWVQDAILLSFIIAALLWSGGAVGGADHVVRLNAPPRPPTRTDRIRAWLAGPVMQNSLYSATLPLGASITLRALLVPWQPSTRPFAVYSVAVAAYNVIASLAERSVVDEESEMSTLSRRAYTIGHAGLWISSIGAMVALVAEAARR